MTRLIFNATQSYLVTYCTPLFKSPQSSPALIVVPDAARVGRDTLWGALEGFGSRLAGRVPADGFLSCISSEFLDGLGTSSLSSGAGICQGCD